MTPRFAHTRDLGRVTPSLGHAPGEAFSSGLRRSSNYRTGENAPVSGRSPACIFTRSTAQSIEKTRMRPPGAIAMQPGRWLSSASIPNLPRPRLCTGLDWTHKYPQIVAAVSSLGARQACLDGELCGVGPDGITSFSMIQLASDAGNATGLVFFPFDLLHLEPR